MIPVFDLILQFGCAVVGDVCQAHRVDHRPNGPPFVLIGNEVTVRVAILYPCGLSILELSFFVSVEKRSKLLVSFIELRVGRLVLIAPADVHIGLGLRIGAWVRFLRLLSQGCRKNYEDQKRIQSQTSHANICLHHQTI
jgi:hypothetical protein